MLNLLRFWGTDVHVLYNHSTGSIGVTGLPFFDSELRTSRHRAVHPRYSFRMTFASPQFFFPHKHTFEKLARDSLAYALFLSCLPLVRVTRVRGASETQEDNLDQL